MKYEDGGHVDGASYQLVQTLPDGKVRVIDLDQHALDELRVHKDEWKDG